MDAVAKIYTDAGFTRPRSGNASWVSPTRNVHVWCDKRTGEPGVKAGSGFRKMSTNPVRRARFAVRAERLLAAWGVTPRQSLRRMLLAELREHEIAIARIQRELATLNG
jgi:hypothetical protein